MMKRLFDEHAKPTHCAKRDVHSQIAPLLALAAQVQKQLLEYRVRLDASVLEDDSLAGKAEHIHQTLAAAEREAAAFAAHGRSLARTMTQLDRYLAEAKADIERAAAPVS